MGVREHPTQMHRHAHLLPTWLISALDKGQIPISAVRSQKTRARMLLRAERVRLSIQNRAAHTETQYRILPQLSQMILFSHRSLTSKKVVLKSTFKKRESKVLVTDKYFGSSFPTVSAPTRKQRLPSSWGQGILLKAHYFKRILLFLCESG